MIRFMGRIKIAAAADLIKRTPETVYKYVRLGLLAAQWDKGRGCLVVEEAALRKLELPRRGRPNGVKK